MNQKMRKCRNWQLGVHCEWCHEPINFGVECIQSESMFWRKWHKECTPIERFRRFSKYGMNKEESRQLLAEEHRVVFYDG